MSEQEKFIQYFLDSLYANMDMEHEAVYSKEELRQRYRLTLDALIEKKVYKGLSYK